MKWTRAVVAEGEWVKRTNAVQFTDGLIPLTLLDPIQNTVVQSIELQRRRCGTGWPPPNTHYLWIRHTFFPIVPLKNKGRHGQGSKKWVSWVSGITEHPISHGNFSLEITYKMSKKRCFWQYKFLSQNKRTVTEKNIFVTEKKCMSQKKVFATETCLCH